MQRRWEPQLVLAVHSQRPAVQALPEEQLVAEVHVTARQLPVAESQRPAPHAVAGLRRQSGVQTPRESSMVTDWHV
jgi:hypothetical protein